MANRFIQVLSSAFLVLILATAPTTIGIFTFISDLSSDDTTFTNSEVDDLIETSGITPGTGILPTGYPDNEIDPVEDDSDETARSSSPKTRASWNGNYDFVVIATEFPDEPATRTISNINGTVSSGMRNYYSEISYNNFMITSTIVNNSWLMMPHNITYYTENDKARFSEYITDAIDAADPLINFYDYRTTSNRVELVILVHSGQDEATSGDPLDIWSHMSGINPKYVDSSYVTQYCTVSEFSRLGTYVHEFGHLLGLPDLYDKDYSSDGIGLWGLMAAGSHLNGGNTPGHMSAWSKMKLGWLSPTLVTENLFDESVSDVERNAVAYKIPIPVDDISSKEYFLVENRYKTGKDLYLPASGLLVWHVDDNKLTSWAPNNDETHKLLDVEETTATQHLDDRNDGNAGDSSDVWSNNPTGFTPDTDPNSKSYSGANSKFWLEDISGSGPTMTADFIVRHIFIETWGSSTRYAQPGTDITIKFNITSDRASGDLIDFTLFGATNGDWANMDTTMLSIPNDYQKGVAEVTVTIPPGILPNNYCDFYVYAQSTDDTETNSEQVRVYVSNLYSFRATKPVDLAMNPNSDTINSFKLFNLGNVKTTYELSLSYKSTWQIFFWDTTQPDLYTPELKAFSNETVQIFVEVPRGAMADEKVQVTINILSSGDNTEQKLVFNVTVNAIYGLDLDSSLEKNNNPVDADQTIQYEFTITALGNTQDTVSIDIDQVVLNGIENMWDASIKPSSSIILDPNMVRNFYFEVTIPTIAKADEKHSFTITVLSEDGTTNETTEFKLTIKQFFGMEAKLDSFSDSVKPGENIYFFFKITNKGNGNDTYNISLVSELLEGWTIKYPANIDDPIEPSKTVKYSIVLTSDSMATAKSYNIRMRAKSLSDSSLITLFSEDVEIERLHSVVITAPDKDSLTGGPGNVLNFTLTLENKGNDAENVVLSSGAISHGQVHFKASIQGSAVSQIQLLAGETRTILVVMTVWDSIDTESDGVITVKGKLEDDSFTNQVPLYYTVNIDDTVDKPDGDSTSGDSSSDLLGGTVGMIAIILIVVVVIILAMLWLFVFKSKSKKGDAKVRGGRTAPVPVDAEVVMIDPVTGYPITPGMAGQQQAFQQLPQQGMGGQMGAGYDPMTGQPVMPQQQQEEPASEAPLRFDPQTGAPLTPGLPPPGAGQVQWEEESAEENNNHAPLRFDPQTGEPLQPDEEEIAEAEVVSEDD